ncbi:DUF883 family protein [Pigmentiphaga litoralis]|uniref:ElaB/YqjD/DUF883 family membrane-anchored ribosome-binding protein n=1 Tax=Pigmentiphaga litoralis TaxID=516702 RepID=A0A7Y9LN63_9BURK|nr:DUF883 family protein [Pigmentiphaga litoralis]NYE26941.1 ElaB/YqjD/DUF883 family membrane-anchored ribosome-binding protein [Pigmentiphaga litoralis]NYE85649.1 ElaB/YqjD/DUF883 family membrane-anchored ribosome-binding protein [Pigmentiphaga litoralis]
MGANAIDVSSKKEKIASNFRGLVEGAEDLLRSTAAATGTEVDSARSKLNAQLSRAKGVYSDLEASAIDSYKEVSETTDAYVRENPWRAVGIAAAVGVLVSLVALRR